MMLAAIKETAGTSLHTLNNQLGSIYEKLDVHDEVQAARFIPMNARKLRHTAFYDRWLMERSQPILSRGEASVFQLLDDNLTYQQIALQQGRRHSAIRNDVVAIRKKFGITERTERTNISLRRLIGAATTLDIYDRIAGTAEADGLLLAS